VEGQKVKYISDTTIDLVIVGLRLLQARLSAGDLEQQYVRQLQEEDGSMPDADEIDGLIEYLNITDEQIAALSERILQQKRNH
jgi:hypothetical protein